MKRLLALATVLVLAGCGQAPEQRGAERAVTRSAARGDDARCTSRSRIWFKEGPPARVFLCTLRLEHGLCDRYRVERRGRRYAVRLVASSTDCALPAG